MLDLILEFLMFVFGDKTFKKLKSRLNNRKLKKSERSGPNQEGLDISNPEKVTLCTGCGRPIQKNPVYERGKPWCSDCYKTDILKVTKDR